MKKILDLLFIKNSNVDRSLFNNLYFSYDKLSFAGFDYDILIKNQIYDSYEILKERHTVIAENHNEYKYFIKINNKKVFIRIVSDYLDIVYDIMIYDMYDEEMYNKFNNIFFPNILVIPKSYDNINKTILYIDNIHIYLVRNEDWDYKNKCLNMLDVSIIGEKNVLSDFNEKDFVKTYTFKMNGTKNISLKCNIKYLDGFYYIDEII